MDKKNKKQVIIGVTALLLVTLTLLGLTYAYYRTRIIGNTNEKSVSVTSKKLEVTYQNESAVIEPTEKIEPGYTASKTFEVKNTGDDTVSYSIKFDNITNTFVRDEDWTYTLTNTRTNEEYTGIIPTRERYIVYSVTIGANITDTYRLDIEYVNSEEDQSIDMGKSLTFRINIADSLENPYSEGTLAYSIINNAMIGSTGTVLRSEPETKVAEEISQYWTGEFSYERVSTNDLCDGYDSWGVGDTPSAAQSGTYVSSYEEAVGKYVYDQCSGWTKYLDSYDSSTSTLSFRSETMAAESTLSMTNDDYGTSYYYRGNVEDNFVTFAGMCWRIVRIDGNGNTKLILEDQDEVCSTTMNGNWDIEASDGTNITLNGTAPYRTGNFGYDISTGKYKMSYLNPVDNPNRAMVNAFKYFQTNTLTNKISSTYENKSLSDYLVSGNWCLNEKAYSDTTGTTILENPTYTSSFYYDSYVRLYGKTTKEPTLKCPVEPLYKFDDNQDGVISSNETDMYVGTITADEIVYAGGKVYEGNSNYYLINNWQATNSQHFWSLSPDSFDGDYDLAFLVGGDGLLSDSYVDEYHNFAFRPSVSLVSSAVISSGEGTLESPYIIG